MILTTLEKSLLSYIENNVACYNDIHPGKDMSIRKYIAGGNRIDILIDGNILASMLTISEAYYFTFGALAGAMMGG